MMRSLFSRLALCAATAALLPAAALARLYVANQTQNQINIYPTNASGNTPPLVIISGSNTQLSQPMGVAVDANYIYVANWELSVGGTGNSVTIYPINASGNAAPVATIYGSNTGLSNCIGIAVDANNIYVCNVTAIGYAAGSITVYPKTTGGVPTTGNVAPLRTIGCPTTPVQTNLTGFVDPYGVAVDGSNIYISSPGGGVGGVIGGEVCVYPLGASGNAVPSVVLLNVASGLSEPTGIAVDANYLYVGNESNGGAMANSIVLYALAGLNSASTPSVTIQGAGTGLNSPIGLAIDGTSMYVRNATNHTETVYPLTASGNAAPTTTLGGVATSTDISIGYMMAVDATVTIPATHFVVSAPATATSSTSFNVMVSALDASNNPVPSYSGTVQITATDVAASLPINATLVAGVGVFPVTLKKGGVQTVTATDTLTPSINGSALINVTGGTATHLTVTIPFNVTAGVPFNATVTALDNFNNVSIGYTGTVAFTSSDGSAILPANSTLAAGTQVFSVTFNTVGGGAQALFATDTVTPAITGNGSALVAAGAATHFSVSAPSSSNAGNGLAVTITARDAANNTVTGYAGTVHFTSTDGLAVVPVNSVLTSGTGTFFYTLKTAGAQTVTATDTVTSSITGTSGSIAVGPSVASHFLVSAPATATAGTPFNVTFTALDQYGNTSTFYTGTVRFTSSDGLATLPANFTFTSGSTVQSVTLQTAGSQTVTATDMVSGSITGASGTIAVSAGGVATHFSVSAPGTATAGVPINVTVTALNSSNAVVPGYSGTVHFTSTDGLAVLPANTTLTAGTGTLAVTLKTAGSSTVTATDTVTGSINGTSAAIVTSPGAATHLTVTAPGSATAGTSFNVTVAALDAFNNVASGYGGTVHFTSTDGLATLPADFTVPGGSGIVAVTLRTAGSKTVTATDTVSPALTATSAAIVVGPGVTNHLLVSAPGTATAATGISVTVTALDAANNVVTAYAGTVHFTSTDGSATLPANSTLTAGTGSFPVTLQTAGGQTVTATDTVSGSITGTSGTVTVAATPATHFTVTAPATAIPGVAFNVTVTALTAANATATGYTGTVHFTSTDGSATLPANTTLTAGTGTLSVTLQTAGAQTVTATDTVTGSITGTSGTVGVATSATTHFSITGPSSGVAGIAQNYTVTALNSANATVAGYTGTVHFAVAVGTATLPANSTLTAGTGTFPVTFTTSDFTSLSTTDTAIASITGSIGVMVAKGVSTVTLGGLNPTYTGSPLPVTANGSPAVASITVTYNGSATVPTNVGTYALVATVVDPNYTGNATGTLTISPANQTITFGPITAAPVNTPITLSATATSGLPVTFTVQSGPGTITGGTTLTLTGSTPVVVSASQAGDSNHNAATSVTQSVTASAGTMVGVGGVGGGAVAGGRGGLSADASGASSGIAATVTGSSGTLVGYLSSLSAGFTANFTLSGGSFSTTTTTLTGGASLGQTLTITGTLSGGVLSGTIAPLGAPFSITLDPAAGASAAVSGLYQDSSSTSGSVTYSIVGTQGELFVLAITPGLVSAGTGTVTVADTFSVTTGQGTTISGSVSASTGAIGETVTPPGGTAIVFSGLSAGASPTVAPAAQSVASGTTATLTVTTSAASPNYQWQFNGVPISGATGATLSLPLIGMTQAGTYSAVVTSGGTNAVSNAATVTVTSNAWLANLSCRAFVAPATSASDVLISGFITTGSASKQLLVRGAGPGLAQFNIPGYLVNPSLTIFSGSTASPTLTSWSASLSTLFASLGAFPFPPSSADTASSASYLPGAYTAMVSAADGKQSGVALVEVYDADRGAPANRLVNLSGRAFTGTGTNVLVGGFVIGGTTSETVLLRAIGPQLGAAPFNVPGTLAKPLLQIFDTATGGNRVIAQIQGWGGAPTIGNSAVVTGIQPATAAVMASVGAFSLASGSADSAMVLVLPPGAYTVQVSGADGGSGIALVEIYEVP